eukprot:scaffold230795_cov36-Tisochrysis_lutea.AAC.2
MPARRVVGAQVVQHAHINDAYPRLLVKLPLSNLAGIVDVGNQDDGGGRCCVSHWLGLALVLVC